MRFPNDSIDGFIFTKGQKDKAKRKKRRIYLRIFHSFNLVLLSVPFHIIDGIAGNIFNQISTSVSLNIAFFLIFLFFAGSFFGYYDITLPSSIANKSSKAEEAGGIIGIFFYGFNLGNCFIFLYWTNFRKFIRKRCYGFCKRSDVINLSL